MAAQYADEEEIWRCQKHPSRRRRIGVCHVCLRERLALLCPECANTHPCPCYSSTSAANPSSSLQSSSSSSLSFLFPRFSSSATGGSFRSSSIARPSTFDEIEPSFHRSRSVAVPSLQARSDVGSGKSSSLWSIFRSGSGNRSKRVEAEGVKRVPPIPESKNDGFVSEEEGRRRRMGKSRSVAGSERGKATTGWYFPSPIKALKQSISRNSSVHERSPMRRG